MKNWENFSYGNHWENFKENSKEVSKTKKLIIDALSSSEFEVMHWHEYGSLIETIFYNNFGVRIRSNEFVSFMFLTERSDKKGGHGLDLRDVLIADNYYGIQEFMNSIKDIDDTHFTATHVKLVDAILKECNRLANQIKPKIEHMNDEIESLKREIKNLKEELEWTENRADSKFNVQHMLTRAGNYLVRIENNDSKKLFYMNPEGEIIRDASEDLYGGFEEPAYDEWEWALNEWSCEEVDGFPDFSINEKNM